LTYASAGGLGPKHFPVFAFGAGFRFRGCLVGFAAAESCKWRSLSRSALSSAVSSTGSVASLANLNCASTISSRNANALLLPVEEKRPVDKRLVRQRRPTLEFGARLDRQTQLRARLKTAANE